MNLYTDFSSKNYIFIILSTTIFFLFLAELTVRLFIIPIPNTTPNHISLIYMKSNKNIAIGDSHIYRAFIANNDFLNLGRNAATIPIMKITLEQYFKYRTPEKVIIEASPQFFSRNYIARNSENYERYFSQNYPFLVKIYLFEPGIGSWIKKIKSPNDFIRLAKQKAYAEAQLTIEGNWKNINFSNRIKRTERRIKEQQPVINSAQKVINIYEDIIKYLLEHGANICMLRTPVDETYLKLINNNSSFSKAIEIFKKISIKYKIHFIDFQDLDYNFSLDKFINQDHITPKASIEFSQLVNNACFEE